VTAGDETFEVHALRYATRPASRAHEVLGFALYGEPDAEIGMDYYFWLLRNGTRTVLLDCGFDRERAAPKGRLQETDPLELLARMDVRASDVDHVVISHMHYDHVGNVALFPNATVSIAREEYDFWSGPYGGRELMRVFVEPEELRLVQQLEREGRLHLVDGAEELFPGLVATRVGGHTPGQMVVDVATAGGRVVLASDAMHYYEEMERDRPFHLFSDLGGMYRGYEVLRELASRPGTTVVAGHDPRDTRRFRAVRPDCLDLADPIEELRVAAGADAGARG
jgi:glyoxylase-like metal-dependent hydrolase (beta-lactamase superfamily II)